MTLRFGADGHYMTGAERLKADREATPCEEVKAVLQESTIPSEYTLKAFKGAMAYTTYGVKIEYHFGSIVRYCYIPYWAERTGMSVEEITVSLIIDMDVHELIHYVGEVGHDRHFTQSLFNKVLALMGHPFRLRLNELEGKRTYPSLNGIVIDLEGES